MAGDRARQESLRRASVPHWTAETLAQWLRGRAEMGTMTVTASDEVLKRLRHIADERGVPIEDVIREALEEKAESCGRLPSSLRSGASGYADTARRIGDEGMLPRS